MLSVGVKYEYYKIHPFHFTHSFSKYELSTYELGFGTILSAFTIFIS
jgi:hypothetical protein